MLFGMRLGRRSIGLFTLPRIYVFARPPSPDALAIVRFTRAVATASLANPLAVATAASICFCGPGVSLELC